MLTSVAWLNRYLNPATVTADEAEHVLTHVGFPIESREALAGGDARLDVELTSNRGDCLCHVGLAREIAAATGRGLVMPAAPAVKASAMKAASVTGVENRLSDGGCPRFTARVIRGVKVGPSPRWMVEALESVGQRSINNVVDVTNFINLELGHPCHVFDLNALAGKRLIVRHATPGERVTALDGRSHAMNADEMVVADAERAVSIAGVIGGLDSGVTERTVDVLFEMATWDPVAVRRASRRLEIRTEASHRFERYVDARDLEWASRRGAAMVVEVAGGELLEGMIDAGASLRPKTEIVLRATRCEHLLGIRVEMDRMAGLLRSIGIEVREEAGGSLRCVIPPHRHDLTREVDLIEEVVRLNGLDKIGLASALDMHLELSHPDAWAKRERATEALSRVLTGAGFFETVTFSFITQREAEMFRPRGLRLLKVDEERRKGGPYLRPSVIPSLLTCRRANQDGKVRQAGGVRLFECASVFAEQDDGAAFGRKTVEMRVLTLLADAPAGLSGFEGKQAVLRAVRGAVEAAAAALGGSAARVDVEPVSEGKTSAALEDEIEARVKINGKPAGLIATISGATLQQWGLESPVGVAEVWLQMLIDLYPPKAVARELPRFPGIERDLSVIVAEEIAWGRISDEVLGLRPALLERLEFVGVYRGKPIEAGKKSVTFRLIFRDPERTLRHEEVDPQMAQVVARVSGAVGGVLRTV